MKASGSTIGGGGGTGMGNEAAQGFDISSSDVAGCLATVTAGAGSGGAAGGPSGKASRYALRS